MTDDLKSVLDDCWRDITNPDTPAIETHCRWCHHGKAEGHAQQCPCVALSLALEQRDALAGYARAQKRTAIMQGAVRLAKKDAKAEVKRRQDESVLQLEAAIIRLREFGIEEMIR